MKTISQQVKGVFAVVIASVLWGTTGTSAYLVPEISAYAIGAFSMGVGGVLLVIYSRKHLLKDRQVLLAQPYLLFFGAISVAIYPLAFYSSMRMSGVTIGTIVSIASAPLFTAILEFFLSKKHISIQWLVSFIVGAIGITLLVLGKAELSEVLPHALVTNEQNYQNLGIVLGCIAGLTYAIYSWVARCLIERGVHSQSSMSSLFGFASFLLLPSLIFTGDNILLNSTSISVSLYMAIIPMFLGYSLFSVGLKYIEASKATLITLIEPLIATLLAVYIIGENFEAIGWLGMALILLCLVMQTMKFNTNS